MTINVGDKLPSVTLRQVTPEGPKEVTTDEFFRGKKVALFAVPGAFTPACSQRHLPGFVEKSAEIKAKGIDEIACVAVNDAAVMGAWGKDQKCDGKVTMLADGSGDFARRSGSNSISRRAVSASAQSAIRCWSTTASSNRSMSNSNPAKSRPPAPRRF